MEIGNRACKGREGRGGGQDNHQQERGRARHSGELTLPSSAKESALSFPKISV